jgi:tetratricopeptide (TPR) repeat protein
MKKSFLLLGNCALKNGQYYDAISYYRKAIADNPKCAEAYIKIADILSTHFSGLESFKSCLYNFRKAVEFAPDLASFEEDIYFIVHHILSTYDSYANLLARDQKNYHSAIRFYQMALEFANNDKYKQYIDLDTLAEIYKHMGYLYHRRLDDHREAIICYQKALDIATKHFWIYDIYSLMGWAYQEQGKYLKALSCYQKSIMYIKKDDVEKSIAYTNMAAIYAKLDNYTEAFICFQKAKEINGAPYYQMGMVYLYELGNYPEAIRCFEEAVGNSGYGVDSYYHMGYAYGKQGNFSKEEECYKKAAELGHEKAQNWIWIKKHEHRYLPDSIWNEDEYLKYEY